MTNEIYYPAPSLTANCLFCDASIPPDLLYCNAQHGIAYRKAQAKAAGSATDTSAKSATGPDSVRHPPIGPPGWP